MSDLNSELSTLLKNIVQFLGEQDKDLKTTLLASIGTAKAEAIEAASTAVATLRTELVDGAPESLDTFKELAAELNRLKEGGSSTPEALLQKITEIKNTVDRIQADLNGITLEGLQNAYRAAQA
ncbi:hypothetical protein [Neisseria cinerea]|uniref:Uncharacterized protein n=1 Tax=Neisseria cinerea TaxID=483 RepID=A0A7T3BLZ4_NEICI|nr:hypothetical protein [Neisseria cinerea]QPT37460.1 hypothetical protein I6G28_05830 [Neisseria cinerea]SQF83114.1 Uncharacterised protein [Neisseria cinerea]